MIQPPATTTIHRSDPSEPGADVTSPKYRLADLVILTGSLDLHDLPTDVMLLHALKIAEVESPLHLQELSRRVTELAGLKRTGRRIRQAVRRAVQAGVRSQGLELREQFVWIPGRKVDEVRDRSALPQAARGIEMVPPEELCLAIRQVVDGALTIDVDEAVFRALLLLGFQRSSADTEKVVLGRIEVMVHEEVLLRSEGKLSIAAP